MDVLSLAESMGDSVALKLLVIGDTRLYCDGVANLLRPDARFDILGVAYTAGEALDQLVAKSAEIALVDIGMPEGWQLVRTIARSTSTRVVALGISETQESVILCAEAGAAGYVPRCASVDELVAVLISAHNGELRCSPKVAATLLKRVAALAALAGGAGMVDARVLTQREREIVDLIVLRMSNKQIARRLGIENATVKNHVHNILEKLHLRRRQEIQLPVGHISATQSLSSVI